MPSPTPKPSTARRRGSEGKGRTLRAPSRRAPRVPVDSWPDSVKAWWRRTWKHPVASEWDTEADLATVTRLGSLYAALEADPGKAALHAQAVRLETELLLTPLSRKRAYVKLPSEDEPALAPVEPMADRRRAPQPKEWDDDDPRRLLLDG